MVAPVSNVKYPTNSNYVTKSKQDLEPKKEKQFSSKEVVSIATAACIAAAAIGGFAGFYSGGSKARKALEGEIAEIKKETKKFKDKFYELISGGGKDCEERNKIRENLKEQVEKSNLGYDPAKPRVPKKGSSTVVDNKIKLPEKTGTNNRAGNPELVIPEIKTNGEFNYTIPTSSDIVVTHGVQKKFKPQINMPTTIAAEYADSVRWDNDKIARDTLQNFFDGHGQTLNGVKLSFLPGLNGRYKIRISGDSTYSVEKAIYLGSSVKRDDSRAAGNYGEGLKMSALKILNNGGGEEFKIASGNWELIYKLADGQVVEGQQALIYTLKEAPVELNGNYIEFETNDFQLLETFRKTIHRFYHANNQHFVSPDFENDMVGFKKLAPNEKGGIYIAGQRIEFDNDYDGLKGAVLFIKEKPPRDVVDLSRDRVSLNSSHISAIATWLGRLPESKFSNEDRAKFIKALEPYWEDPPLCVDNPMYDFTRNFVNAKWDLKFDFPSDCVATTVFASADLIAELKNSGYRICQSSFGSHGMTNIAELMKDIRDHNPIKPNDTEKQKLAIIKEALDALKPSLEKHFEAEEIDSKIYIFDASSSSEAKMYENTSAEAIIEKGRSIGFWIDQKYLNKSTFGDVLETALHELCHKVGGDGSSYFSYKLTDVNAAVLKEIVDNPEVLIKLQELNKLWEELSS